MSRIVTHVTGAIMWMSQTFPIKFYKNRGIILSNLRNRAATVAVKKLSNILSQFSSWTGKYFISHSDPIFPFGIQIQYVEFRT
jgi:hypothetical protein